MNTLFGSVPSILNPRSWNTGQLLVLSVPLLRTERSFEPSKPHSPSGPRPGANVRPKHDIDISCKFYVHIAVYGS